MMSRRGMLLWGIYALFVACALYLNWHERLFDFSGRLGAIKLGVWVILAGFLAYSIYCRSREDLFRSIGRLGAFHWGRQIGADLYLGLSLGLLIIYLNEGGFVALLWLIPVLVFANLAILLYFAIHFDSIVMKFLG